MRKIRRRRRSICISRQKQYGEETFLVCVESLTHNVKQTQTNSKAAAMQASQYKNEIHKSNAGDKWQSMFMYVYVCRLIH